MVPLESSGERGAGAGGGMVAICGTCEARLSVPTLGACRSCKNAHKVLADYWRDMGMPLAWADKPRRIWLPSIRVRPAA